MKFSVKTLLHLAMYLIETSAYDDTKIYYCDKHVLFSWQVSVIREINIGADYKSLDTDFHVPAQFRYTNANSKALRKHRK